MKRAWPTPQEERWLAVARRHPALREPALARAGGWKTVSLLNRVLMFFLGLLGASMVVGSLLWIPLRWAVAGIAMIAAGEWLIRSRWLVAAGIEEALIAGGAVAIVGQALEWASSPDDAVVVLAFSLALLVAGLRLGNALFATLAALGISLAIAFAGDRDLFGSKAWSVAGLIWCLFVTIVAIALGARRWQRPSHDRLCNALVVAMPLGAFAWAITERSTHLLQAATALALTLLLLVTGIRRREHAPLVGALLQLACLAYALRDLGGLPLYGCLLLWGALLLAAGVALERGLRRPRGGVTSAPLAAPSVTEDLVQAAGAAHLTPASPTPPAPGFEGQGGGFAGGGATGRY